MMLLLVTMLMQQGCGWVRRRKIGQEDIQGRNAFKAMRVSAKGLALAVWQQDGATGMTERATPPRVGGFVSTAS